MTQRFIWNPSLTITVGDGFLKFHNEDKSYLLKPPAGITGQQWADALCHVDTADVDARTTHISHQLAAHGFLIESEQFSSLEANPNLGFISRYSKSPKSTVNRINQARVLILGCGGIGQLTALALCAAGVEHITLVDFDRVSASNLNRQFLYELSDIGSLKAPTTASRLMKRYASLDVTYSTEPISSDADLARLLGPDVRLVVCGIDHPVGVANHVKRVCGDKGVDVVSGGVGVRYGHIETTAAHSASQLDTGLHLDNGRDTSDELTPIWSDESAEPITSASIGTTNGIAALMMAHAAISILGGLDIQMARPGLTQIDFQTLSIQFYPYSS